MGWQLDVSIFFYVMYRVVIVVAELFSIYHGASREAALGNGAVYRDSEVTNVCVNGIYDILPIGL